MDSTILLLFPKCQAFSHLLWLYPFLSELVKNPVDRFFSKNGSYNFCYRSYKKSYVNFTFKFFAYLGQIDLPFCCFCDDAILMFHFRFWASRSMTFRCPMLTQLVSKVVVHDINTPLQCTDIFTALKIRN